MYFIGENRKALALATQLAALEKRRAERADQGGKWVEYRNKRDKSQFYYNTASRRTTKEMPAGFVLDRSVAVKEVIYGLHFYH